MNKQPINERNAYREGQRQLFKSKMRLVKLLEEFVRACDGKEDAEIRELYQLFNAKWIEYANRRNRNRAPGAPLSVYPEAFAKACGTAWKDVEKFRNNAGAPPFDYRLGRYVFRLLRKRGFLGRMLFSLRRQRRAPEVFAKKKEAPAEGQPVLKVVA